MSTFTSTLPDALLKQLSETAKKLKLPKNKLIEKALTIYLDQVKRAEYIQSYKQVGQDEDIMAIAEEGMEHYFKQIEDQDASR
jgi:predicted transcriptional regulator